MIRANFDLKIDYRGSPDSVERPRSASISRPRHRKDRMSQVMTDDNPESDSSAKANVAFVVNSHVVFAVFGFDVEATTSACGLPVRDVKTTVLLDSLYRLCRDDATEDEAIDLVYSRLSEMLAAGETEDCDDVLEGIDVTKLTAAVIASLLTISAGAKSVLTERRDFYNRARDHLVRNRGESSTERLLVGLA